ncbi:MAG: hypothetical protein J4224_02825 [Candidatus Diapherotrites archaeon]|uniref:Uncharacterized protein n=1 Tax=Candidatus Iainarchaeum sp. TaxID=3101447 RepID=A0A7J4IWQ8_9ARCH|nr:MAG: hypothetical protein QT03_C0001G1172 [archaeon GW2011_AR10]MBS3059336.1 hypothetical protein [Candidatus Diapherotrites archaeon]HIH08207.1 hypothetical protein [Candidatus Diapherotrites archaeon]
MIKEYFNSRISALLELFRKNPILAIISMLFFIFYSLPVLKLYFINQSMHSLLLYGSYASILSIAVFYFANKKVERIKQKSVFKDNNYLKGLDIPKCLFIIWGTSLLALFLSAFFSIIVDFFSVLFSLLNIVIPGNEKATAISSFVLSIAIVFLLFNNAINRQLVK